MKYVFGPLKSRRLGNSLGINLLPRKICTYDCVYCQLGLTEIKTVKKFKFNHIVRLLEELSYVLQREKVDYITFAGLGEPTLVENLGDVISKIKKITKVPIAVITNGSLIFDKGVQKSLLKADLVVPSLDAISELSFRRINRPLSCLNFKKIVAGLIEFRRIYNGLIWLEIMLVKEFKVTKRDIDDFKRIISLIKPDLVHLVSPTRIKDCKIHPLSKEKLSEIREQFGKNCVVV